MALITGKCQWAKVYDVDRMFVKDERTGKDKVTGGVWSIDLIIDETNMAVIQKEGLAHLINEKEGVKSIKFKRNEFKKVPAGEANKPPNVVDAAKNPIKDLIGNGSTVNISFTTHEGFKSKMYPTLQTVQVVNLVAYKAKSSGDPLWDLDKIEGGYVAKATNDDGDEETFDKEIKGM